MLSCCNLTTALARQWLDEMSASAAALLVSSDDGWSPFENCGTRAQAMQAADRPQAASMQIRLHTTAAFAVLQHTTATVGAAAAAVQLAVSCSCAFSRCP